MNTLSKVVLALLVVISLYYSITVIQYCADSTIVHSTYVKNSQSGIVFKTMRTGRYHTNVWDNVLCEWVVTGGSTGTLTPKMDFIRASIITMLVVLFFVGLYMARLRRVQAEAWKVLEADRKRIYEEYVAKKIREIETKYAEEESALIYAKYLKRYRHEHIILGMSKKEYREMMCGNAVPCAYSGKLGMWLYK